MIPAALSVPLIASPRWGIKPANGLGIDFGNAAKVLSINTPGWFRVKSGP